jgi:hypothetical protein
VHSSNTPKKEIAEMSQIITQATTPLWKAGNKGNIEFLSSFKRLEKEEPGTFRMIEQKEGFACQDHDYEYKVGKNQYGLWLSRRKMGLDGLKQIEVTNEKPQQRPPMTNASDATLMLALTKLADSIKLLALAHVASSNEQKEQVRHEALVK